MFKEIYKDKYLSIQGVFFSKIKKLKIKLHFKRIQYIFHILY